MSYTGTLKLYVNTFFLFSSIARYIEMFYVIEENSILLRGTQRQRFQMRQKLIGIVSSPLCLHPEKHYFSAEEHRSIKYNFQMLYTSFLILNLKTSRKVNFQVGIGGAYHALHYRNITALIVWSHSEINKFYAQ